MNSDLIDRLETSAAVKREQEVVTWAAKCGACDGMQTAIDLVLLEAGKLFAHAPNEEGVQVARGVRDLGRKLTAAKMQMMRDLPATPQPSPNTEHMR